MSKITALYADENGEIFDAPNVGGVARSGNEIFPLKAEHLIPLPEYADLMYLPERRAMGILENEIMPISGRAVAAILPAGYTRLFFPAYEKEDGAEMLPLFGYTAVVLYKDELYIAAAATDESEKWDLKHYNTRELKKLVSRTKKDLPNNRLVNHLADCSLKYHCCTAQNLFYRRWEAGIPVSPVCNANCLGCISLQPAECCPSPQSRIEFRPTAKEVSEVGIYHLSVAPDGIISFGQGCEGEPSLAADVIAESIGLIRKSCDKGQININSNAGYTEGIKKIIDAGLDTMRVSIISAREECYNAYYRSHYALNNVKESIEYALKKGVYISLNLLYFPGFNDTEEELASWKKFLRELPVQMVQMRNLNIDPDVFLQTMPKVKGKGLGAKEFVRELKNTSPNLVVGSFSHFVTKK